LVGTASQVGAGGAHACAVTTAGTIWCWGDNGSGQTNEPAATPGNTFEQVSSGDFHSCALRTDGTATCWGDETTAPALRFKQLAAGGYFTCGLKGDGSVACWGGSPGVPDFATAPGAIRDLSSGAAHVCAIRGNGALACWGSNSAGQLNGIPAGTFRQVEAGTEYTCAVASDSTISCWGHLPGQYSPPAGVLFRQVTAGWNHTCAIGVDGYLRCWGWNSFGQADAQDGIHIQADAGYSFTCGSISPSVVACFGRNDYGQASAPVLPTTPPDDTQPPLVEIALTPPAPDGKNGWYRQPVTVQPNASDPSGVAELRCALDPVTPPATMGDLPEGPCTLGDAPVTADGRHSVYAAARDTGDNVSEVVSATFRIRIHAAALTSLEKKVNRREAYAGNILHYQLKVRNLTGAAQQFEVTDLLPEAVTYLRGSGYEPATRTVTWQGTVQPGGAAVLGIWVRVNADAAPGTRILNEAVLADGGAGARASASTVVIQPPPPQGLRADVDISGMAGLDP
jgi:uncharacterized repeat protein (TIGR01451 family)